MFDSPGKRLGAETAAANYDGTTAAATAINRCMTRTAALTLTRSVAGGAFAGVCYNKPGLGKAVDLVSSGLAKITTGAAFAAGVPLASDATGRVVAAAAGDYSVGTSLVASTAADEIVAVDLDNKGYLLA